MCVLMKLPGLLESSQHDYLAWEVMVKDTGVSISSYRWGGRKWEGGMGGSCWLSVGGSRVLVSMTIRPIESDDRGLCERDGIHLTKWAKSFFANKLSKSCTIAGFFANKLGQKKVFMCDWVPLWSAWAIHENPGKEKQDKFHPSL